MLFLEYFHCSRIAALGLPFHAVIVPYYISLHQPPVRTERDGKATTTRGTGLDSVEQKLATRDGKEEEKEMRYPPRTAPRGFQFIGI
jgi:hypothetical protein